MVKSRPYVSYELLDKVVQETILQDRRYDWWHDSWGMTWPQVLRVHKKYSISRNLRTFSSNNELKHFDQIAAA